MDNGSRGSAENVQFLVVGRCGRAVTGLVFFLVGHPPLVAGPCHGSKKWTTFHADVGPSPVAPFRIATGDRTLSSLAPACVGRSADPVWYYGRHDEAPSSFTAPLSVLHLLAAGHVPGRRPLSSRFKTERSSDPASGSHPPFCNR